MRRRNEKKLRPPTWKSDGKYTVLCKTLTISVLALMRSSQTVSLRRSVTCHFSRIFTNSLRRQTASGHRGKMELIPWVCSERFHFRRLDELF